MSVLYCETCDKHIDTDFNAEHFEECVEQDLIKVMDEWLLEGMVEKL